MLIRDPVTEEIVRSGDWLRVQWYSGTRRTEWVMPNLDGKTTRTGWVRDRLFNCFEE